MKKVLLLLFIIVLSFSSCKKEDPIIDDKETTPEEKIFDIVGELQMNDGPHDMVISGKYLYACRGDKIFVIDISTIRKPVLIAELTDLTEANHFTSVSVGGNDILYVGCRSMGYIYIVNISNPSSPQIVSKFDELVEGNKLVPQTLFYADNTLWAGGSNGANGMIVKFNIPSNSTLEANNHWLNTTSGTSVHGLWMNSTNVFSSAASGFVHAFDKNDISNGYIGSYTFDNEIGYDHWGRTIVGKDSRLYWADWGAGFITLDISNPSNLSEVAKLTNSTYKSQHPDAEGTMVYDVALHSNGKIFVANGWSGLLRLDQSNPGIVEDYVDYHHHQYYCLVLHDKYAIVSNISGGISGDLKGLKVIRIE